VRARWSGLIAVAAGLIGVGAFPRFGVWPLAIISVALLSVALQGRRPRTGAWIGYLYGLAFTIPLLSWTGIYVGPGPWLILAAGESAFFAVLGAALTVGQRQRFAPAWIAACWVLEEALRDRLPFGGFPWGRLAFSQSTSPLRWFAALGGAPLVTFAVALAGGALAGLVRLDPWPADRKAWLAPKSAAATGLAVALAVPLIGGLSSLALKVHSDRYETIAVIQGSVPDLGLDFEARAGQVLDNHVAQTMKLAAKIAAGSVARPSLVIWPENASDLDPFENPSVYTEIDHAVKAVGAPILVGAILDGPGPTHRRNVGIMWSPTTGPGSEYTKRHPVPFGEYIPLRSIAKLVSSDVSLVERDMVAGTGNGLLTGGPFPIGDVICFEVAYDGLVRSSVRAGAQLLIVQTNNATFGHTAETYQQLAMSRLRAVETGRTVVQAATTGVSAVIAPDGHIMSRSGALYTADTLTVRVPLSSATTLATRLGAWPEYVLSAIAVALLVAATITRLRERGNYTQQIRRIKLPRRTREVARR
jgi:apolipoprotein N-acyltransferase